jgi:uncharacterized membrane protein YbhN (UPF0104 family)
MKRMSDVAAAIERAVAGLVDAVAGLVDAVAGVALGWLVLGVALHLANQVARGRGWYAIVRTASAEGEAPRRRDVVAAWVAGAGAGGVVSARGGDAVRVLLLARRMPGEGCHGALLTGTLVAETAGECLLGAAVVLLALAAGVGPELGPSTASVLFVLGGLLTAVGVFLVGRRVGRVRRFLSGAARGCAALRDPRAYAREVLPWQLASRLLRIAARACFLVAFGLPATPAAVLLVVFAQTSGRLVPFSPAAVGAGAAILAATFEPVTGTAVPAEQIAAFFMGTSAILTVVGTALALAICLKSAAQAPANARLGVATGRLTRMRAAMAPRP